MQENRTHDFEFGKGYILKGYKKKSRVFGFFFFVLSVALVVSFSIFSANLIVGVSFNASSTLLLNEKTYYLLSLNSFESEAEAEEASKQVKLKQGAGYVYNTIKSYEVIAFAYINEEDCLSVKSRLEEEYKNCHIIPLKCKKINASVPSEFKGEIAYAIKTFDEVYSILYSIATSYSSSKEYYTSMNLINEVILSIESKIEAIKQVNSSFTVKLKSKLNELMVDLKKLVDVNERVDTFETRIKYATCCAIFHRYSLA